MKKKLQFLLASLVALCSLGTASAQTWTASSVAAGNYVLYNVGSGQYFTKGNGWGTQASIADFKNALPVELIAVGSDWFIRTGVNGADYGLENLSGGTCYTDQSRGKQSTWTFTEVATDNGPVYTILSADSHTGGAGKYLAANSDNTIVGPSDDPASPYAQWKLGTDVEAGILSAMTAATASNPVDVTDFIGNHNFTITSSDWTMVASNMNLCGGATSNPCAESWRSAFTLSQTITLPNGTYEVNAQAMVEEYTSTGIDLPVVYANDVELPFAAKTGTENSMSMMSASFTAGLYKVGPLTVSVTNNKLTIGVKGTRTDTWSIWDNFTLTYLGAADAATTAAEINSFSNGYAPAKNEIIEVWNAVSYTDQNNAAADFATAVAAADNKAGSATDEAQVQEAVADLKAALFAFLETAKVNNSVDLTDLTIVNANPINNLDGWTKVKEEKNVDWANHAFQPNNNLFEYWNYRFDFQQTLNALPAGLYTLTLKGYAREGADNIVLYANNETKDVIRISSSVANNTSQGKTYLDNPANGNTILVFYLPTSQDVTIGVRNNFTQNDGWTVIRSFSLQYDQHPFLGAPVFDIKKGAVVDQETFENEGIDVTFPYFAGEQLTADPTTLTATYTVELRDAKTNTLLDSKTDSYPYTPDAKDFAAKGLFKGTTLATEGFYKVSIASTTLSDGTNNWINTGDWYTQFIVPGDDVIAEGMYFLRHNDSGQYLVGANDWGTRASVGEHAYQIYVSNVSNTYQLNTGICNGGTGSSKRYLGTNLYVDSDVANWNVVCVGTNAASNKLFVISNEAGALVKDGTLINQSTDVFSSNAQWEFVSVEEYMADVIAKGSGDMTPWIMNYNFAPNYISHDKTFTKAWEGNPTIGNKDNKDHCAEKFNTTYDVYQVVRGLPAGHYKMRLQGFYRSGFYNEAAQAYVDGNIDVLNAYYYARGAYYEAKAPLMSICADAPSAQNDGQGFSNETNPGGFWVPNTMQQASQAFKAGKYWNNWIDVAVGEDGILTIGVKKDVAGPNGNWTIFDTFELKYTGAIDPEKDTQDGVIAAGDYIILDKVNGGYLYVGGNEGNELTTYARGSVFTVNRVGLNDYYLSTNIGKDAANSYVALTTDKAKVKHLTVGNAASTDAVFRIVNAGAYSASIKTSDDTYLTPAGGDINAADNLVTMGGVAFSNWKFIKLEDYLQDVDQTPLIKDWGFDLNSMDSSAWQGDMKTSGKKNNTVGYMKGEAFDGYQVVEGLEPGHYYVDAQIIASYPDGSKATDVISFYAETSYETKATDAITIDPAITAASKASFELAKNYNANRVTLWFKTVKYTQQSVRVGEDGVLKIGVNKVGPSTALVAIDNIRIVRQTPALTETKFTSWGTKSIYLAGKHPKTKKGKVVKDADGNVVYEDDKTYITDLAIGNPKKFEINAAGYPEITLNTNDSISNGLNLVYVGSNIANAFNANYRLYATISDKAGNVYHFEVDGRELDPINKPLSETNYNYTDCALLLAPGFFGPNEEYTIHLDYVDFIDFANFDEETCEPTLLSSNVVNQFIVIKTGAGVTQNAEAAGIRRQLKSVDYAEDDTTTGIAGIAGAEGEQTIYNLAGQRVSKAQKGIYVINGRKVVVK